MQDQPYILVIREPAEEVVRWRSWQASMTEQLNHVAVMVISRVHAANGAPVVFEIQDVTARTIRFTSPHERSLLLIADYARELGLEVVRGPVQRPDARTEQLERWVSHLSWASLEHEAERTDLPAGIMQLVRSRLGKFEHELAAYVTTWGPERISNRLKNTKLAVAERRLLEQALTEVQQRT